MTRLPAVSPGQILTGSLFSEPMRVETVVANGSASLLCSEERRMAKDRHDLFLPLRRDRLRQHSATPGADPQPGAPRLERSDEGGALLLGGERDDEAHAGA